MTNGFVRPVTLADSDELSAIYGYYVTNTVSSFETEAPPPAEFRKRIEKITRDYPYLVYEADGAALGYVYASQNRQRAAYRYNTDLSLYVRHDALGQGIGTALYDALFARLRDYELYTAYAAIVLPNAPSIALHEKFGFRQAGLFRNTGYKFGQWRDVVWLEKTLRDYMVPPR